MGASTSMDWALECLILSQHQLIVHPFWWWMVCPLRQWYHPFWTRATLMTWCFSWRLVLCSAIIWCRWIWFFHVFWWRIFCLQLIMTRVFSLFTEWQFWVGNTCWCSCEWRWWVWIQDRRVVGWGCFWANLAIYLCNSATVIGTSW